MDILGVDCGCDVREDTIGSDNFWLGTTAVASVVILSLIYGGKVSKRARDVVAIAIAGAVSAIVADQMIRKMR